MDSTTFLSMYSCRFQPKPQLFGKYTEEMFFEGDQSAANPMRYLPTPFHTKYAQQRTALSQYIQQEAVGTRMRRWERPIHDFLAPYLRGAIARVTGEDVILEEVQHRRDLDTLTGLGPFPAQHIYIPPARGRGTNPPPEHTVQRSLAMLFTATHATLAIAPAHQVSQDRL